MKEWEKNGGDLVRFIKENFIAVSVTNGAGWWPREGNGLAGDSQGFFYLTASGRMLREGRDDGLWHISEALDRFKKLPVEERQPRIDVNESKKYDSDANVPKPPPHCLIARHYRTYLEKGKGGELMRAQYAFRPGSGGGPFSPAMTEPDVFWMAEAEWRSLVPKNPQNGGKAPVPDSISARIFIYCGQKGAWAVRGGELTLTVQQVTPEKVELRLDGYSLTGDVFRPDPGKKPDAVRDDLWPLLGTDLRWLGFLRYDRKKAVFDRFEIIGVGTSWGYEAIAARGKWHDYAHLQYPVGVALQLSSGERPADRIPPAICSTGPDVENYFGGKNPWRGKE